MHHRRRPEALEPRPNSDSDPDFDGTTQTTEIDAVCARLRPDTTPPFLTLAIEHWLP